jgi:phytoene synthase
MMLAMMDPDDGERAHPHARSLGEAFQLTNFLRDVRDDALQDGRLYLPRSISHWRHGRGGSGDEPPTPSGCSIA